MCADGGRDRAVYEAMHCRLAIAALFVSFSAAAGTSPALAPSTTDNNDTCDIAVAPAATLFLPYFEVDFQRPRTKATQTIVTVVNVSSLSETVNVTLWTDWAYPALRFPLSLRAYEVRTIDFYDVFARGTIGSACGPDTLSPALLSDLRRVFTTGIPDDASLGCGPPAQLGGVHDNASGYATIDVVEGCPVADPFAALRYDNVLIGDYEQLVPEQNYAHGGTLVHLRAIPEGGPAGSVVATNLPYTFYNRFTTADRRQPLPSAFVTRFVAGGPGAFNTSLRIWREAFTAGGAACTAFRSNSQIVVAEVVRFDEHENATVITGPGCDACGDWRTITPAAVSVSAGVDNARFPWLSTSGDTGGWLYLNLNNPDRSGQRPSQNWVISSTAMERKFAFDLPAVPLGNGCSPARSYTWAPGSAIRPSPNPTP
jgi:hypothetical protein